MKANTQDDTSIPITGDTRLNKVLDAIPDALEYVVSLRPHDFDRLRNPFMRKHMSPRISLRRVAAMAGIPELDLLANLARMAGRDVPNPPPVEPPEQSPQSPAAPPPWLDGVDPQALHWVDLLPIDDVLGDPFMAVNLGVRAMNPGDVIGIRHRWEPQPLYDIWQKLGLEWYAHQESETEWYIFVHKPAGTALPVAARPILLELRFMSEDRIESRLLATMTQLRPGDIIEAWCAPAEVDRVFAILQAHYSGTYTWEQTEVTSDRAVIAIHSAPGARGKLLAMRAASTVK